MPPGTYRKYARWVVIASSGGIGLYVLLGFAMQVHWGWTHLNFGELIFTTVFSFSLAVPFLLIAGSLLLGDDGAAVEVVAVVVAFLAFGGYGVAAKHFGVLHWASPPNDGSWKPLRIVVGLLFLPVQFLVPFVVYRLCRRLGYRFLGGQPLRKRNAAPFSLPPTEELHRS